MTDREHPAPPQPAGAITEEGLSHEYYWRHMRRRGRATRRTAREILALVRRFGRPGPLLELGVGLGFLLRGLRDQLPPATPLYGLDLDPLMIDYARQVTAGLANVHLLVADVRAPLPFADASQQTVCLEHTVHHLDSVDGVFREIARVLAPDGVCVLIDFDPRCWWSRVFLFGYPWIKRMRIPWPIAEAVYRSLRRSLSFAELERLAAAAGLRVVHRARRRLDHLLILARNS